MAFWQLATHWLWMIGIAAGIYTEFPNPQKDFLLCGRRNASFICDPEFLLDISDVDRLDYLARGFRQSTNCLCSSCETGISVGIFVKRNLTKQAIRMYQNGKGVAEMLRKRWRLGKCDDDIVILLLSELNISDYSMGPAVKRIFPEETARLIVRDCSIHFQSGWYYQGLESVLRSFNDAIVRGPNARGLQLQFENFSLPNYGKNGCQSYVDLIYSTDRGLKNLLFCPEDLPSNFTINSSTVHVRFSSGFIVRYSNESVDGTGYGFSIVYRAISREISKIGSTLKIFIPVSLVVTICLMCFCWYKWCRKGTERTSANAPNVPTREQLDAAFAVCVSDMNGEIQSENSVGDPAIRNITSSTSALEVPAVV